MEVVPKEAEAVSEPVAEATPVETEACSEFLAEDVAAEAVAASVEAEGAPEPMTEAAPEPVAEEVPAEAKAVLVAPVSIKALEELQLNWALLQLYLLPPQQGGRSLSQEGWHLAGHQFWLSALSVVTSGAIPWWGGF